MPLLPMKTSRRTTNRACKLFELVFFLPLPQVAAAAAALAAAAAAAAAAEADLSPAVDRKLVSDRRRPKAI
jgi:hypothetical protein